MSKENKLPLIPIRELIIFPSTVSPMNVGREFSIEAVHISVEKYDGDILLIPQKDYNDEDINSIDYIEEIGVKAKILQLIPMPDSTFKVIVEGMERVKIKSFEKKKSVIYSEYEVYPMNEIAISSVTERKYRDYLKKIVIDLDLIRKDLLPSDFIEKIFTIEPIEHLFYLISLKVNLHNEIRYSILSSNNVNEIFDILVEEIKLILELEKIDEKVDKKIKKNLEKNKRKFYIREKIKEFYSELEEEDNQDEIDLLEEKIEDTKMPKDLKEKLFKEIKRLKKMNDFAPEASVIRSYIETILELSWEKSKSSDINISKAEKVLNKDHFGLEKVKNTILEYLAVNQLNKENDKKMATILCLVGPPGIGKTSFATSIARAMNRKFERISLGGVSDEAEIRGHRRTYVGAMPGRIIEAMRKVKVNNPVILLDEIDKLSKQFKGDPASALLEVLDPAQNKTFKDNYIDFEYDLSDTFFICTANYYGDIPKPLLDRMEVIFLESYTTLEKLEIAKNYLIPQVKSETSIKNIKLKDEIILDIINKYTSEAGVRNLKREILKIFRKIAKIKLSNSDEKITITSNNLKNYLGVEKYKQDKEALNTSKIGIVKGLAWTQVGGTTLDVEAVKMSGKGNMIFTGQLGDVMKESVNVAYSFVRANDKKLKVKNEKFYLENDIHIHFPEGATPKDGPSAGITITTALVSILSERKVKQNIAMTGEITIRGDVLPIGGVKEKVLAAYKIGIKEIILPYDNISDSKEIPEELAKDIKIHFVKNYEEIEKIIFD